MPKKDYFYNVVVGVAVNTRNLKSGGDEVEKRLTSWERKALKAQEQFEKLSLAIEKANRKPNTNNGGGFDNAMLRAMADIVRMQRQIENGERALTHQLEREAKLQATTKAREMRRAANEMIREIDRIQKAEARQYAARNNLDKFGRDFANASFLGSFFGNSAGTIAGNLINQTVSGIARLGSAVADVGLKAIQLGADFEQTTNSMIVFAGGTANAQRELAELDETARKTTGLRLADAEAGYKQLRALNFEIDSSRRLITGLAKQRLLSGANEQDVQRVIVNLTQLSAGSNRASQDIKEIFHTMPSLRREFALAFGTLDYQKIGKIFSDNPQEAIAKLSEQLEKAQGATGGLTDAWGKMLDEFIVAGRELSTPVLPELTKQIQQLTKALAGGSNEMNIFGIRLANLMHADQEGGRLLNEGKSWSEGLFPLYEIARTSDREAREIYRRNQLGAMRKGEFLKGFGNPNNLPYPLLKQEQDTAYNSYLKGLENKQLEPERKNAMEQALADVQIAMQDAMEKARRLELGRLESYYSDISNIRTNALRLAEAQNENNLEVIRQLHQSDFQAQIKETAEFYNKRIALNDGNAEEVYKLTIERNNKIRDIQANAYVDDLRLQKQIEEKKRQDLLASNELIRREISQFYDTRIADLQRAIDRENGASSSGFDELFNLIQKKSNLITQFTREQYEIRLQDTSLTAQQRINLEKEMYLALEDLARETYQNLIELNDKRFNKTAESLKEENQRIQESLNLRKSLFSSIENSFKPSVNFGQGIRATSILGAFGSVDGKTILSNIQEVTAGTKTFFDAQRTLLNKQQEIERTGLENQIDLNKQLLVIEQNRVIAAQEIFIANQKTLYENSLLLARRAEGEGRTVDAENYRKAAADRAEYIQKEQEWLEKMKTNKNLAVSAETQRLRFAIQTSESQQKQLQINQDIEQSNLKQISDVNYLNQLYQQIASGQKDSLISQMRDIDLANERIDLAIEFRRLQIEAQQSDPNAGLKIQVAYLRDIIELRNQETEAIIQTNRAQLLLSQKGFYSATQANARFLDFLNQNTKSLTEIYSDARIGVITSFWDSLDVGISKVTDKLGVFGDVLKQVLLDLIKLATSQLFAKFFGGGGSNQNQSSGGFGGFFNQIFGGGYRTPSFNPNSSIFGGNQQGFSFATNNRIFPNNFNNLPPALTNNVDPQPLSNAARFLPPLQGGLIKTQDPIHVGARTAASSLGNFSLSGLGKSLGSLAPMLGLSLGGMLGGNSVGGQILGSAGGLISGTLLNTLISGGFTGATASGGIFGSIGGLIGLSGAATAGIALAAIPLLMLGSWLFGKSKQRRADERTRNSAMVDSLRSLDKLISDVNADKIDGDQAISQAEEIRQNYLDNMRQLKDSKTRRIALADVSRLDSKITALKAAATAQQQRKDKLVNFAPTFADGGAVSRFASNNYRHNPLGYITGPGTSRSDSINAYFPVADEFARISNREYVLDAETTSNVGVRRLDILRANRGRNFNRIFQNGYADGGAIGTSTGSSAASNSGIGSGEPKVFITNIINQDSNGRTESVTTEVWYETPQGKKKIEAIVEEKIYENGATGAIPKAISRVNNGQR